MADAEVDPTPGEDNDDSWLYGDGPGELRDGKAAADGEKAASTVDHDVDGVQENKEKDHEDNENEADENDDSHFNDEHFADVGREEHEKGNGDAGSGAGAGRGDSDSDDSDDVKVTIGDIKAGPQAYASLNIKRGVGLVATGAGAGEKARAGPAPAPGKVSLEDLDGPGSINGVPALEFNIDTIEDKPWNKPGADISDYFNYGFNEVTWSAYCERQRRMRVTEAGVALLAGPPPRAPPPDAHLRRMPGPPRNDEGMHSPMGNNYQARENTIQVMTAERREYGRAARDPAPPEYFGAPPDHYFPPHAPYDEPWGHPEQSGWAPSDIKELTPGPMGPPNMGPPPGMGPPAHLAPGAPHLMPAPPFAAPYRAHAPHAPHAPHPLERARDDRDRRDRDRERRDDEERDRDRERSRSIKPERLREKSYRRERSRSRSRRHKSRSRSPRLRERSRERERERSRERERDRDRSRDRERSLKPKSKEAKEKEEEK